MDELSDLGLNSPESLDWGRELGSDEQVYKNISQAVYAGISAQYPETGFDVYVNVSTAGYQVWAVGTDGRVYGEREVLLGPDGKVLRDESGNILYGNLRELAVLSLLNPLQIEALGLSGYQDIQWGAFPPVAVPEGIDPSEIELVYVTENGIARFVCRARGVIYAAYDAASNLFVYAEKSGIAAGGLIEGAPDIFATPIPLPLEFTPTEEPTSIPTEAPPLYEIIEGYREEIRKEMLGVPVSIDIITDVSLQERHVKNYPIEKLYLNPNFPNAANAIAEATMRAVWYAWKDDVPEERAEVTFEGYMQMVKEYIGGQRPLEDVQYEAWANDLQTAEFKTEPYMFNPSHPIKIVYLDEGATKNLSYVSPRKRMGNQRNSKQSLEIWLAYPKESRDSYWASYMYATSLNRLTWPVGYQQARPLKFTGDEDFADPTKYNPEIFETLIEYTGDSTWAIGAIYPTPNDWN